MQPQPLQELRPLVLGQLAHLGLDRRGHHHGPRALGFGTLHYPGGERVALGGRAFFDIADIQHRLRRQQLQAPHRLLLALRDGRARRPAFLQGGHDRLHQLHRGHAFLVAAAGLLLCRQQPFLQAVQVREHQLGLDRFRVTDRVDAALHMGHVPVLEAAQHVDDRVHLADIGQELVAQALALGCAANQAGDVDEFQAGGHDPDRLADFGQCRQARVGHADAPGVRLDGAERVIRRLCRGGCR